MSDSNRFERGEKRSSMLIEVLYMPGCPNHQPALHRLRKALQFEEVDVPIREILVSDEATARSLHFPGSLPQYASMARTQNQMDSNPSDLLAGCTRVVAVCPQKKHYNAQFLQQSATSEAYEGVGKGSACRSHCCPPFQPLLAACRWDSSAPRDWQA